MSRFVRPDEKDMTDKQREIEPRAIDQMFRAFPQLEYKDSRGTLLGPYPSLYYTPDLVDSFFDLAKAVVHQPNFTFREREVVVLAVIATNAAPYPLYAHSQIALACGLTEEQIQEGVNGVCPTSLSDEEAAAYEFAYTLANSRGPLSQEAFTKAEKVFGQARLASFAHLVAVYIYVALMTNIGDCITPEPRKGVFLAQKTRSNS